jgi:hypothetical protein
MWLSFSKRRPGQRTQANHSKTNRLTYRPRLEALEDRTLLSPVLLDSFSQSGGRAWAIAVDSSGAAYVVGEGNMDGKLNPSGTGFTNLPYMSGGGGITYRDRIGRLGQYICRRTTRTELRDHPQCLQYQPERH